MYYLKYIITKTKGGPVDPQSDYFVLRLDKDPVALQAAEVYAKNTPDKELGSSLLFRIEGHKAKMREQGMLV